MLLGREEVDTSTVRKLSRAKVDLIPLVSYIPPPRGDLPNSPTSPIAPPPPALLQPVSSRPVSATPTHFVLFPSRKPDVDLERGPEDLPVASPSTTDEEWQRTFSPSPYPVVCLPENRATCAICRDDFEALPQLGQHEGIRGECDAPLGVDVTEVEHGTTEVRVESLISANADGLQFVDSDSSGAPEPLRLLRCGHVYHVRLVRLCTDCN